MGFLQKLFGIQRRPTLETIEETCVVYADEISRIESLEKSAIGLFRSSSPTKSFLGGTPNLSAGVEWPSYNARRMDFLGQIDLSDATTIPIDCPLPTSGTLAFFYDYDEASWGYDPADRGKWKVVYSANEEQTAGGQTQGAESPISRTPTYVSFRPVKTYPAETNSIHQGYSFSRAVGVHWLDLFGTPDDMIVQLGGFPDAIQYDAMDEECQLISYGISTGTPEAWKSPQALEILAKPNDWILLAQFGPDDDLGFYWGDSGNLYYWIKRSDLANQNFDNVWLILQCT